MRKRNSIKQAKPRFSKYNRPCGKKVEKLTLGEGRKEGEGRGRN
jgi:hypothetical protein